MKQWIKTQKELASMERRNEKAKVKGATDRRMSHEAMSATCKDIYEMVIGLTCSMVSIKRKR